MAEELKFALRYGWTARLMATLAAARLDFARDVTILPANSGLAIPRGAFFGASDAPSRERTLHNGQGRLAQDQAALDRRHRLFLCHPEERPHQDREADVQEIRSCRAQACRVQGNKDQVSRLPAYEVKGRLRAPFLFSGAEPVSLGADEEAKRPCDNCSLRRSCCFSTWPR